MPSPVLTIDGKQQVIDMGTSWMLHLMPWSRMSGRGRKIEFPIILDNMFRTWERYGIPGLGTVVLVDPHGNLVEGDASTLHRMLD